MRLKEDAMRNGLLKPAYNVQYGVDSEYIVWQCTTDRYTHIESFSPYIYRGKASALAQTFLIALAHNFNKLHHKIQAKRTGTHLSAVQPSA